MVLYFFSDLRLAAGNKGTLMEIELLTGAGTAHGFGVAKDNKENVYRVLF